jgi:hypothetical protein
LFTDMGFTCFVFSAMEKLMVARYSGPGRSRGSWPKASGRVGAGLAQDQSEKAKDSGHGSGSSVPPKNRHKKQTAGH